MNVKEIRNDITKYTDTENFQALDGRYGIKLLLDRDKFPVLTDCIGYIIGNEDLWNIVRRASKYFLLENKHSQPEPLSLAVYSSTDFTNFRHLGIVSKNLTIISKWGLAPVYEHPVMHVPKSYGKNVEYFRVNMDEITKLCHPSLTKFLEERK